jgi:hypothetical protein
MRKLSIVVAALATLALALAPGAEAASADLVGQVQQQLTRSPTTSTRLAAASSRPSCSTSSPRCCG